MRGAVLVVALAGCGGDGPRPRPPPVPTSSEESGATGATAETGTTAPAPGLEASCVADPDNVLRYWCDVRVHPAQPVEIAFVDAGGVRPERVHSSSEIRTDHRVPLYLLTPETPYQYVARALDDAYEVEGAFVTGELPQGADALLSTIEGTTTASMFGMASPCVEGAYALIMDPISGRPLWYHDFALGPIGFLDAVSFTEDGTVLAIVDARLAEVDLTGRTVFEVFPTLLDVGNPHHDVFRKDGLTWSIFQEAVELPSGAYLMDGFAVFDPSGSLVGEWHLADIYQPPEDGIPGDYALDVSHANAIWVDDDHQVTLSMRHLSAILQLDGDPASPTFGEVAWRLANPASDFGTDFLLSSAVAGPDDFERQHNAFWTAEGRLTFLDNRSTWDENSRVVEVEVDPLAREATILAEWNLPVHCDYQGAAWRTAAGNPVGTCAPTREAYEFDGVTGQLGWHANVTCTSGSGMYVPRFVPLEW